MPWAFIVIFRCLFYYLFLSSWQAAYQHENAGVFPGKICSDCLKNHSCGQKKPKSTTGSSAIFGVEKLRTQAVCWLSLQQNRQGKFELFAWTLMPNFFRIFFPLTNLFLTLICCLCLFCYKAGQHAISRQKHRIQHRVISSVCHFILVTLWCGRTVTCLLRHYQNFLAW